MEVAATYCRLGYLNLYNPCKPEGSWELDLSRREERIVAKTLCLLATMEPGDNWPFKTFRWMRSMESMPGWELVRKQCDCDFGYWFCCYVLTRRGTQSSTDGYVNATVVLFCRHNLG